MGDGGRHGTDPFGHSARHICQRVAFSDPRNRTITIVDLMLVLGGGGDSVLNQGTCSFAACWSFATAMVQECRAVYCRARLSWAGRLCTSGQGSTVRRRAAGQDKAGQDSRDKHPQACFWPFWYLAGGSPRVGGGGFAPFSGLGGSRFILLPIFLGFPLLCEGFFT